jgi:two-component system LytT family response regulator
MLICIVVDDEVKSIKSLEWELEKFNEDIKIKNTFTDTQQARDYLSEHEVDFIFLDIEMPKIDGFEFLEHFEHRDFDVIFVTAYDQYAIKAIKAQAFDYLLKPVEHDELKVLIDKMLSKKEKEQIDQNLNNKIQVAIDQNIRLIDPEGIIYCQSDGNYCHIYLKKGESHLISKKLKYMEEKLEKYPFMRVHNSYIINLNEVHEINKKDSIIILNDGTSIPISRSKKDKLFNLL